MRAAARAHRRPAGQRCARRSFDPEVFLVLPATAIETRYGLLDIPPNQDDIIARFLIRTGEWSWDEVCFVAGLLDDGARVLDGGAFLGTFSLGLGLRRSLGALCCVEANPQILPLLEANLRRNATVEARIVAGMLAGQGGAARPGHVLPGNLGSVSFLEDGEGALVEAAGGAVTLAALREQFGSFDLIKLDVEGLEAEILRGDADALARGHSMLWLECNESPRSLDLVDLVLSWGLPVHYFAHPSHNPDNIKGEREPIFPWAYEAGLLVAPRRPPALTPELAAHGCILRDIRSREDLIQAMWLTPRWLPPELAHASAPELAAVAGRALLRQERERFLVPGLEPTVRVEDALAEANDALLARQGELDAERAARTAAEAALAEANDLLLACLNEATTERELRVAAEAARAEAQDEAAREHYLRAAAETRLADAMDLRLERIREVGVDSVQLEALRRDLMAIRSTIGWRLVSRVNAYVGKRPWLHAILRRMRSAMAVLLGRRASVP
ncbi:FkbM family methyltransferase [Roseicella aquatilis]|uniref:FkbM family methyltransferase n=1 Tax=Roseicella aquatilis TaxID=2527868 RepID=A0A4R4DML6_9PROT|nr:FkbM family methyltransferase [Roseicella aquatilis]TCZ60914.1 FkbM family methyltransferase [Roseicella aquatilis]